VAIFDLSPASKFLVQGADAEEVLNMVCTNDVSVPVGRCVETLWLNEGGTIEAMMTVLAVGVDTFMLLTSDVHHSHVHTWLKRHLPADAFVVVTDVTSGYAGLSVQGPRSRELISCLTDIDLSNEAFPFGDGKEIDLQCGRGFALRQSSIGELGWELLVPCGFAQHVYDALIKAGQSYDLKHAGAQTLNSLRIEKAYPEFGDDVNADRTPLEAGLGNLVDCNKATGFVGKEAFLRQKESGLLGRRLVQFLLQDPEPLLCHGDIILMDGTAVGYIRSSGYGHTLGGSVGLGYVENPEGVTAEMIREGSFEIDVAGVRVPAVASLQPLYDPENEKCVGSNGENSL
jgi:4-methylaminobutanoate oxidase (formaldehyde-forming)